jgi:hypothetical protein
VSSWIDRRCCNFDTFLCDVMRACERLKFPLILVDWCEARRYWRRYGCTGAEVVKMQRAKEINDGIYLYLGQNKGAL